MIDMTMDTIKLVLTNKMFENPPMAYGLAALGAISTAALMIVAAYLNVPLWLSGIVAGFLGGLAMPYLYKDIRFK